MSETVAPEPRKTPRDATEFEREQLRYFLSREDALETLLELNPSLAWLPELMKMEPFRNPAVLTSWIERNFNDPDAVREVAANIDFFNDPRTADLLEHRLNNQLHALSPLLQKCWRLIVRHVRENPRGMLRSDWYDLVPRIKAGELSTNVLESIANVLRPRPKIGKRFSWPIEAGKNEEPTRPSDLMRVDFEIEGGLSDSDVLEVWPKDANADIEKRFLTSLNEALTSALGDAIDAEVESNSGYGVSDADVPSVADHPQNEYRSGFLPIVRVIAEIWTRLADKGPDYAISFSNGWSSSPLKLIRRLALFSAANPIVPSDEAAKILLQLPQGLLFLTNASVEVFRLLLSRWQNFSSSNQIKIEARICEGPPRDWFKSDAADVIDRCRYDLLGNMQRAGLELSTPSKATFEALQRNHAEWRLRPAEQAGFHIWHGSGGEIVGDPKKLDGIPDDRLIEEAKKVRDNADFMEGDVWRALCQEDVGRAFRGLTAEASRGIFPTWAWEPFLWASSKLEDPKIIDSIARELLSFPESNFSSIVGPASYWLNERANAINEEILWPLWEKTRMAAVKESEVIDG